MTKAFPIDFIRQIIEQTFEELHYENPLYVGGKNLLNLFSFYEQLNTQEEVDRYVEFYRDLTDQQNNTDLIANGVIVAPENPTITNINQITNIPLTFTANLQCKLKDRDLVIETINAMIEILKGRKMDVAEFTNGKLLKVGVLGNNSIGTPQVRTGDYMGLLEFPTDIDDVITDLVDNYGFEDLDYHSTCKYLYYSVMVNDTEVMKVATYVDEDEEWEEIVSNESVDFGIVFPELGLGFKKWQVSLSFDSIRCDEPRVLNADKICNISFGGSATITNNLVLLGNTLTKVGIRKVGISGTEFEYDNETFWLEPLEMPASNTPNSQLRQLAKNGFMQNDHVDSITPTLQYTFIVDTNVELLANWFEFARYGIYGTSNDSVSPNTIYEITELYSMWGVVKAYQFKTKIVDTIDVENSESDTLTIKVPMKIQGAEEE